MSNVTAQAHWTVSAFGTSPDGNNESRLAINSQHSGGAAVRHDDLEGAMASDEGAQSMAGGRLLCRQGAFADVDDPEQSGPSYGGG